jgi:hypothetical protein
MHVPTVNDAKTAIRSPAAHAAGPWIAKLARAGYVAKGVQYGTIGLLAALAAVGSVGGETTDSKGAIEKLGEQPFGEALVVLMAFGLGGYALWRFVEAALDPEHDCKGVTGLLKRIGRFGNGALHSALVVYAIGLLTGSARHANGHDGDAARSWSAEVMAWPGGVWLIGAIGLGLMVFGGAELVKAWKSKLDEQLDLSRMRARGRRVAVQLGRFGIAARGVVFGLVGGFLSFAALRTEPRQAKGLGEALHAVQGWTLGWVLLAAIAIGLIAFGAYELLEARYRRIQAMPA